MKKIIFTFILLISFFFSGLSAPAKNSENYSVTGKVLVLEEPVEIGREYILIGDQWYLIIYYDDGPVKIIPVTSPTVE